MATNKQVDLNYVLGLKPEKAIQYFKDKGYKITFDWHELYQEAHAKAFTVSRVTQMDVLTDIRQSIQKSLENGLTYEQFKKDLVPKLQAKGWMEKKIVTAPDGTEKHVDLSAPWRLRTIYRTNTQTAYMAGRYAEQLDNADNMPYWQYIAVMDNRTRPEHRALHGKVFRYDDGFWDSFYPPNGWGCRCRVEAVDGDFLDTNKLKVSDSKDKLSTTYRLISEDTGEMQPVTVYKGTDIANNPIHVSPDVGWSYNVGKAAFQPDLEKYNYKIAKDYTEGIVTGEPFKQFYNNAQEKAEWAKKAVTGTEIKQSKINDLAVDYIHKNLPKDDKSLFQYVAVLNPEKMAVLKTNKQAVKFSIENFAKNIINHPELKLKDYYILPEIVDQTKTLIYTNRESTDKIVCFAVKNKYYKTVIKATKNKDDNYLQSFHITDLNRIKDEKNKKGVQVIYDTLTQ